MDKKIFLTLFTAVFTTTLGVGIVIPILPVYAQQSGAGGVAIGLIFGSFSLSRALLVPVFGNLSDRKGRKVFLTIGLFAYCLVSIAFTFSDDVYWLILVRFFHGITSAMVLPVAFAYVGEIAPPDKEGEVMGLFQVSLMGGLSLGPLLGGVVNDLWGVTMTFISMGVVCFLGFLLCLLLLPNREEHRSHRTLPVSYRSLIKDRTVGTLFIHRICLACSVGAIWVFVPLFGSLELGLSSTSIGLVLMINTAVSAALFYPMGLFADRFDKRITVIGGGLVGAAALAAMTGSGSMWSLAVLCLLHGLSLGAVTPSVMAVAVIAGRSRNAIGTTMGMISMAHSLGMLVGPVLGGVVMDVLSFPGVFVFGGVSLALGTLFFFSRISGEVSLPAKRRAKTPLPLQPLE